MEGATGNHLDVTEEDTLRAQLYGLLASLLAAPPTPEVLAIVGAIKGDGTELGQALKLLATAARGTAVEDVQDEYQALFIGVGAGELTPYASYYLAGFLFEKPLAKLRIDMGRLGIARADHVPEPEDHIASLCEMMCGLITGTYGEPADLARQQTFFDVHLASWAELHFKDLEAASSANFYKPVGTVGRLFMEVEVQAFKMAA